MPFIDVYTVPVTPISYKGNFILVCFTVTLSFLAPNSDLQEGTSVECNLIGILLKREGEGFRAKLAAKGTSTSSFTEQVQYSIVTKKVTHRYNKAKVVRNAV